MDWFIRLIKGTIVGIGFHGMSPVLSQLYHDGYIEARAVEQTEVFKASR